MADSQLVPLPFTQPARRVPPSDGIHRGQEHRDVRIVVDPSIPKTVRVLCAHLGSLRFPSLKTEQTRAPNVRAEPR